MTVGSTRKYSFKKYASRRGAFGTRFPMGLQKDELDRMTLPKNSFYKIVGSFDRRQLVRGFICGM
ncbi:hypothetical protein QC764_0017980 [Podospora pseudoanserina]|uniref:Uncharacterized protein n=1 Tax=Podospora pseudoanserina TaxID=2609844 RepID=A0ABR0IPH3_9PEZI|nr:hypothetical protein QC764_0017980 [Podospora pseudoanserina]